MKPTTTDIRAEVMITSASAQEMSRLVVMQHTSDAKELMGDRVPDVRMTECELATSSAKATAGLRHHSAIFTTTCDSSWPSLQAWGGHLEFHCQ